MTKRIVMMIDPKNGGVVRVTTKEEFRLLKGDGWKPIVLKVGEDRVA